MDKKQRDDESQGLLKDEKIPYDTDDSNQHHSSRLEWAESSWTRFLHVLCWCWINPILSLGYKRHLTENDLDDIPHIDKSSVLLERLNSYDWSSETTLKIIIKEFWKDYILANLFVVSVVECGSFALELLDALANWLELAVYHCRIFLFTL